MDTTNEDLPQKAVNWVHNAFDQVATGILFQAHRAYKAEAFGLVATRNSKPVLNLLAKPKKSSYYAEPPAWATMFQPRDQEESRLIREYAARIATETNFLVYDGDFGVWLAIDEPDGEFFVSHWLPLFVTLTKIYEERRAAHDQKNGQPVQ